MHPGETSGRTAGLLYLTVAVTGGFSMLYVPSLTVPGDAAATAGNIVADEALFRLGVVSGLVSQVVFVLLALALYRLFNEVNTTYASVMVALVVVAVPVAFLNRLNQLAALHVLSGAAYLRVFDDNQLKALAMLFLDLHGHGVLIVELLWGLWLPLGLLVIQARFIPGWVGVLVIVGFLGYVIDFLTRLLFPDYAAVVSPIAGASKVGELAIIFWLLTKGARRRQTTLAESGT